MSSFIQPEENTVAQSKAPPWIEYPLDKSLEEENYRPPTMVIRNRFRDECVVCGQGEGEHCDPVGYALCVRRANALHDCLSLPKELVKKLEGNQHVGDENC